MPLVHWLASGAVAGVLAAATWPIASADALAIGIAALSLTVLSRDGGTHLLSSSLDEQASPGRRTARSVLRILQQRSHQWLASSAIRQGLIVIGVTALAAAHAASARDAVLAPPLGIWFAAQSAAATAETTAANDMTTRAAAGAAPVTTRAAAATYHAADGASSARAMTAAPRAAFETTHRLVTGGAAEGGRTMQMPVRVRGVLEADAARTATGSIRLLLAVARVDAGDGWRQAPGRVQIYVQGEVAQHEFMSWTKGRIIEAPVSLRWPAVARNPGGPSPLRQRLTRGHVLTGSIKSAVLVEVSPARWWDEGAAAVRRHVRRAAGKLFDEDRRVTAAIVTAILIGDRAGLDADLTRRLIEAGTYHVVAISGGNVAIIVLVVVVTLRGAIRSWRVVTLAAMVVVVAYGWIVGSEPSVSRAVTAACVWLTAETVGLRAPPVRVLSVVALTLVAIDPLIAIMPGAWLSFGATLGIVLCASRIAAWITRQGDGSGPRSAWRRAAGIVAGVGAATLAAEIALLPIGAWTFSRVSVAGVLLNFVAVPAMTVVQMAGIAAVVCVEVWPFGATWAARAAHVATAAIVESARLVEWAPILAWRVPPPAAWVVAAYYAAVGLLVSGRGTSLMRGAAWVVGVITLGIIATAPGVWSTAPPAGTMRVTFLDVGQGDAIVAQFPSGQVLVIDAGMAGESYDTGDRVVTPALWALGVSRVDWVAFTHADVDHIGGVESIVSQFAVREVWEGVPVPNDARRAALQRATRQSSAVWRPLRRGDRWEMGGAVLEVLHPPEPDWERPRVRNDDSLVFRLRHGHLEVLLTGDIGQAVERELDVADEDRRAIRVLKIAHHGSRGSSSAAFVGAYRPWAAIVSAGRNNLFGHPAPEVLARLAAHDVTTFQTDRDGAVSVETDGRAISLRTWTGRHWQVTVAPSS